MVASNSILLTSTHTRERAPRAPGEADAPRARASSAAEAPGALGAPRAAGAAPSPARALGARASRASEAPRASRAPGASSLARAGGLLRRAAWAAVLAMGVMAAPAVSWAQGAPTVMLGADRTVNEGDEVTIAATVSDPDGDDVFTFAFLTSTTGPTPVFRWLLSPLRDPSDPTMVLQPAHSTTFTAPLWNADYEMVFTVTARDGGGLQSTATITISVSDVPPPPNRAPVADAGADQTVDEATTPQVTLDGTGSSDPDAGDVLSYCWTQTSGVAVGPFAVGSFAGSTTPGAGGGGLGCGSVSSSYQSWPGAQVSFSTDLTADAMLIFQLVVTDAAGEESAADSVTITVTADDDMPVVQAGYDQRVAPGDRVALPLAIVRDDGGAPTIEWSQTGPMSGTPPALMPAVTLSSTSAQQPTFTAPAVTADTTLTFQLQATEVGGAMRSVTDTVEVVVSSTQVVPSVPSLPVFEVNAGADQTVAGFATVALDGSGSRANVGGLGLASATDWTWTQESGPMVTLTMPCVSFCEPGRRFGMDEGPLVDHLRPTFTAPAPTAAPQVLVFKLARTQSFYMRSDTVTVTVSGFDTMAAVPTVTLPASTARDANTSTTLTATTAASSPTWDWWQVSGAPVSFTGGTTASITFTTPETVNVSPDSVLVFAVAVTSGGVTSAPARGSVFVSPNNGGPDTSPPGSMAGPDVELAEGASATLGATNIADPQGDTYTIEWTQYGGPTVALSDPTAERPTFTAPTNLVATTYFYYWVVGTDEHGHANSDTVRIQVNGANGMPTVNAGPDQTVDEEDFVTLSPVITDEEGIATVLWEVADATNTAFQNLVRDAIAPVRNSRRPVFLGPNWYAVGHFANIRITVTDLHGATASDTVQITWNGDNDPPRAYTCLLSKVRIPAPTADNPAATVEVPRPGARCGSGQDVESGASVALEGRDSFDPEGETITYAWEQVTRTATLPPLTPGGTGMPDDTVFSYAPIAQDDPNRVTLAGATTAQPTFTAPTPTGDDIELFFRLTVTDVLPFSEAIQATLGITAESTSAVTGVVVRARPVVDAGGDIRSHEGQTVTLDGTGSAPSNIPGDTGAITYAWTQTAGTPAVTLSDATAAAPSFTAPALLSAETTLTFRLTVTDGMGNSGTDDVNVHLLPVFTLSADGPATAGEGESVQLEAELGPCEERTIGDNPVRSCTFIPGRYTYAWEQTSGTDVLQPAGADAISFVFRAPTPLPADETLNFRVTVTAEDFATPVTRTATVSLPVTRAATGTRPAANAGDDQTVPGGTLVVLQGSASGAPDSAVLQYFWTQTAGATVQIPEPFVIPDGLGSAYAGYIASGARTAGELRFNAPIQEGTLTFRLAVVSVVTNADGTVTYLAGPVDTVDITVTAAPAIRPIANAGDDLTAEANAAVALSAADTTYTGAENLIYTWTQLPPPAAGPGEAQFVVPVALAGADTATASFTAPSLPTGEQLVFSLVVRTETSGVASEDIVRVFVAADPNYQAADNRAPIAHAGSDLRVLSGASFTLDGRLSGDPDYAGLDRFDEQRPALGYQWTQISGPAVVGGVALGSPLGAPVNVARGASTTLTAPANTGSTAMEMVFRLVVFDGQLFSAPDEVTVTVLGNADSSLQSLTVLLEDGDSALGNLFTLAGPLALTPTFDSSTTAYTVILPNAFTGIVVTAVPNARGDTAVGSSLTGATVAVTAMDASSTALTPAAFMSSSEQFSVRPFTVGANPVTITVTAPDGSTTTTYTLSSDRESALPSNSRLSRLYLQADSFSVSGNPGNPDPRLHADSVALSPDFSSTTMSYTAQVPNQVTSVRVGWLRITDAVGGDASMATIAAGSGTAANCAFTTTDIFGGTTNASGRVADCPLAEGENTLTARIAEQGGGFDAGTDYTVTITRAAAGSDATLSALSVSGLRPQVLPAFDPTVTSYEAQVGGSAMDVLPVTTDPNARFLVSSSTPGVRVSGAMVSGAAARVSGLGAGESTITITVYAEDSTRAALDEAGDPTGTRVPDTASPTTTQTYTLRVTRVGAPPRIAASLSAVAAPRNAAIAPVNFTNSGGAVQPGGWAVSPALPAGLDFNDDTGAITGTPTANQAAADYTVTARNAQGESSAVVSIEVLDTMRAISAARVAETVPEDGTPGAAEFRFTLTGAAPAAEIAVAWTLSGADGAALPGASGADFGAAEAGAGVSVAADGISGSATWASGATLPQTLTLRLPVVQDSLNEGAETLTLTLGAVTAGGSAASSSEVQVGAGATTAVVTVAASDPISVTLTRVADSGEGCAASGRLVGGEAACFTAALGATASTDLTLSIAADRGGSALTVLDVAVSAGESSASVVLSGALIDARAAALAAGGEVQLDVRVSGVSGAPAGATARPDPTGGAVRDIGVVGWEITLSPTGSADMRETVSEGGGFTLNYAVRGDGLSTVGLNAPWRVMGDGPRAASAADFVIGPGGRTAYACGTGTGAGVGAPCRQLPRGQINLFAAAQGSVVVQTAADAEPERTEQFTIAVSLSGTSDAPAAVFAGSTTVYVDIVEGLRTLNVAASAAQVAEDGTPGSVVFTLTLTGSQAPDSEIAVPWTLTGVPADGGFVAPGNANADVGGAASGTVTFPASSTVSGEGTSMTVTVPVLQDELNEGPETMRFAFSVDAAAGGMPGTVPGTIAGVSSADVVIAASDPIAVGLARRAADGDGRLVSGEGANYVATLGATASTQLELAISANLGGTALSLPAVAVPAGMTTAAVTIPACSATVTTGCIDAAMAAASGAVDLVVSVSSVSGAPTGATAAPDAANAAAANIQVVGWEISLSAANARVGEGGALMVTAMLRGTPPPGALDAAWSVAAASGAMQPVPADFARGADYECGAAAVGDACASFPGGTLEFRNADTLSFAVQTARDDDNETAPEAFTVQLGALSGAQGPAAAVSASAGTLEASISDALRQLSVTHPTASIDEDSVTAAGQTAFAEFTITMEGTESPVEAVTVNWTLSSPDDSITLPGAAGLGRNVEARDVGGSRTGTVTFAARVALPATQMVRVPILQDALNEGAENLQLEISADPGAGGRMPGTPDTVPATLISAPTAQATVAASDAIDLQVAAVADDDGVLTPGEAARFRLSFGTTTVNGVQVPIVPSTPITVPLQVSVGGQMETIQVQVAAEMPSADAEVPAATLATLRTAAGGGTQQITVNVGSISGTPTGAMSSVNMASLMAVEQMQLNVAQFGLRVAPQAVGDSGFAEAPEGGSYTVTFTLSGGDAAALSAGGLTVAWSVSARAAMDGGREASANDFGGSAAYSCGGSTSADVACSAFPSGTVTFNPGDTSQTLEIFILDDGDDTEGTTPEGFSVRLMALGGGDAPNTALASGSTLPQTLQVDIPALRADLSVADVSAGEGENAVFVLTLSNFVGGSQTTRNVVVEYEVGVAGDTAERGVDYESAAMGQATILAGETTGEISIPLVRDGLLELPESFTLTLTQIVERGGGTIRFVDPNAAGQLTAQATITDTADQNARREARVGTLVSVLDRSSAMHAAEAISARIDRGGIGAEGAQTASLSLAGRELMGGSKAVGGGDAELGLALYGAAGLGGASAGLPGGGSGAGGGGAAGAMGGSAAGVMGGSAGAAFGGLGAGLAGGANLGARSELPSLAKLVSDSAFNVNVAGWNWQDYSNMTLWGSGGVTILKGAPVLGGAKLDYEGDSTSFFIGGENYVRNDVLAGVALGFSLGDLDFTDHAATGYRLTGTVESEIVSVHPYASWWLAPDMNVWLSVGYGAGTVNLEESIEESGSVRTSSAETDQESLAVTVGASGRLPVIDDATSLALNFQLTRVRSDLDAARFGNGAQLAALSLRSTRIGAEAELGRDFALPIGATLRPFATAQVRLDLGDAVSQDIGSDRDAAVDLGGGADLNWPEQGVTLRLSGLAQLNDTGHQEHRVSVDVNYDLGADGQGLTVEMQSALSARRSRGSLNAGTGAALGAGSLGGAALGSAGLGSSGLGGAGLGGGVQQSLSGEIGYGVAFRQFGRSGLLTPYGRFDLGNNARWTVGLRLSEPRSALELGLEAVMEGAAAASRNYDLLLTGRLRF